ncbi:hypothetical protein GCE9029_01636 [Grimontia celer]|uniref:Uncharacterized protein n=1 Tax=Grimontia celer TaxID=1796497 RepID=A0A128EYV7_9GAMM|nr:hypothetical protein [Grimontia celer]CZF79759.1 hypothetical protein GCE9029_01636 [Grimontia celer]
MDVELFVLTRQLSLVTIIMFLASFVLSIVYFATNIVRARTLVGVVAVTLCVGATTFVVDAYSFIDFEDEVKAAISSGNEELHIYSEGKPIEKSVVARALKNEWYMSLRDDYHYRVNRRMVSVVTSEGGFLKFELADHPKKPRIRFLKFDIYHDGKKIHELGAKVIVSKR